MIKLHQFRPAFGLPNASPFCMKVETYLRMAGLPYECPRGASHFKAPKGKLPYIEDGGAVVADSTFIVEHLKRKYGDKLDTRLTAAERAAALAVQRLIEENLYWAAVYSRWIDEAGLARTREAFFSHLPLPHGGCSRVWRNAAFAPSCAVTAWGGTRATRSTRSAAAT